MSLAREGGPQVREQPPMLARAAGGATVRRSGGRVE